MKNSQGRTALVMDGVYEGDRLTGVSQLRTWFLLALAALCLAVWCTPVLAAQSKGKGGVRVRTQAGQELPLYDDYQALVIGAGDYRHWPRLAGPAQDAREVAAALKGLGFTVKLVIDPDAARLGDALDSLPYGMGSVRDRALLIYFSGHGETETLADGSKLGYIIPTDCPLPGRDPRGFSAKAISMKQMEELALRLKCRHVLMVFDSCFSGSLFNMVKAKPSDYISEKMAEPVRQFITAGTEEEEVPDRSVFKTVFLQGLTKGYANRNDDGYVTGEELGSYLQEKVVNYTRKGQHPQYGKINNPRLDKGDFVFVLPGAGGQAAKPEADSPVQVAGGPGPALGEIDQRKLRIQNLLRQADADLNANRLTSPTGNNAYEKYSQVLELQPMDREAQVGLNKILGKYVELAKGRIKARDWERAEAFLKRAQNISEADSGVLALRDELRKAKEAAASKDAEAEAERRRQAEEQARAEAARKEAERKRREAASATERSSDGRFTKDASGVITDSRTGLQWYVGPDKNTNWYNAKKWVDGLTVAGGGWRLPSRSELRSLYQKGKGSRNMAPIFKTAGWGVWSGETRGSSGAWYISFGSGKEYWSLRSIDISERAFAVRSFQSSDERKTKPETTSAPAKELPKRFTNSVGMEFVLIPAGSFMMGSKLSPEEVASKYGGKAEWYQREHPRHQVTISRPFYLQTTEVTQSQWQAVMGSNPSYFKGDNNPVETVSWYDAQEFIRKLNQKEGTDKYCLPTEAQWEYACRAGSDTAYSFGDDQGLLGDYAWHSGNSDGKSHTVGGKRPNAFGLYDMHGNVWEWCTDWYGAYPSGSVTDPQGAPSGSGRVIRGGSWFNDPGDLRSASRFRSDPVSRDSNVAVGFRVAKDY